MVAISMHGDKRTDMTHGNKFMVDPKSHRVITFASASDMQIEYAMPLIDQHGN